MNTRFPEVSNESGQLDGLKYPDDIPFVELIPGSASSDSLDELVNTHLYRNVRANIVTLGMSAVRRDDKFEPLAFLTFLARLSVLKGARFTSSGFIVARNYENLCVNYLDPNDSLFSTFFPRPFFLQMGKIGYFTTTSLESENCRNKIVKYNLEKSSYDSYYWLDIINVCRRYNLVFDDVQVANFSRNNGTNYQPAPVLLLRRSLRDKLQEGDNPDAIIIRGYDEKSHYLKNCVLYLPDSGFKIVS